MQAGPLVTTPAPSLPGQIPPAGLDKGEDVGFGDELGKALAALVPVDQPAAAPPGTQGVLANDLLLSTPEPSATTPLAGLAVPAAPAIEAQTAAPVVSPRNAQPTRRPGARATATEIIAEAVNQSVTPALPGQSAAIPADGVPLETKAPIPVSPMVAPETNSVNPDGSAPVPLAPAPASLPETKPQTADAIPAASHTAGNSSATTTPAPEPPEPATPDLSVLAARAVAAPQQPSEPASAAPTAAHATGVATPAAQVAPALVSLFHAPDGTQRMTLRLDPPDLGQVQIRIDRPLDAPARVEITVQRAETLTLLLRDQPQLQRALDQAGVPPDGRSVTFHISSPEASPRGDGAAAPAAGMASAGPSGDGSHGASRQGSSPSHQNSETSDDTGADFVPVTLPHWLRAGLDITA